MNAMFKNKKYGKLIALALAMALLVCSLLAIPASAHGDCDVLEVNGEIVKSSYLCFFGKGKIANSIAYSNPICCDKPSQQPYVREKHPYTRKDHTVELITECENCGWYVTSTGVVIGGCGTLCSYPLYKGNH